MYSAAHNLKRPASTAREKIELIPHHDAEKFLIPMARHNGGDRRCWKRVARFLYQESLRYVPMPYAVWVPK
jgi:hypothetical protein